MNEYIFYATEGHTDAPNESIEIENCQVLGTAKGKDEIEAQENLLKENPWIIEANFDKAEFIARQILTHEQRYDIKRLIDYLGANEELHIEGCENNVNHIANVIKRLQGI